MQGDEVLKDALEKVSNRLRKAVGLNRHQIGGLNTVVSQMKRERNRSVGILSKQQQDFIQKQAKLLPALAANKKNRSRKTSNNKVIPLDVRHSLIDEQSPTTLKRQTPPTAAVTSKGIQKSQYNILPPIRKISRGNAPDQGTRGIEEKQRRISDYRKEFSSLQTSLNNAYRFTANGSSGDGEALANDSPMGNHDTARQQIVDDKKLAKQLSLSRKPLQSFNEVDEEANSNSQPQLLHSQLSHQKRFGLKNLSKQHDSNSSIEIDTRIANVKRDVSAVKRERSEDQCDTHETMQRFEPVDVVAMENATAHETANSNIDSGSSNWAIVRDKLRYISLMNRKQHDRYLEQLYNEIRNCRYIRKPRRRGEDDESLE
eukprot:gene6958-7740_t